jgi:hypothetical protein
LAYLVSVIDYNNSLFPTASRSDCAIIDYTMLLSPRKKTRITDLNQEKAGITDLTQKKNRHSRLNPEKSRNYFFAFI